MKLKLLVTLAFFAIQAFPATPAEAAIQQTLASIAKQPAHYPYYNSLAMAYARRARETADVQFYAKAEEAMQKSLALAPDNFEGLKMQAWLQLARDEFSRARESAIVLNKKVPDDTSIYGYLVDANVELGNYQEAIDAAQWMLDLRPGNVPALLRAAYLRELHGNLPGALELLQMAIEATPPAETEDRAWILTQTARLYIVSGDLPQAEMCATRALSIFPDYPYAQTALAQVRIAQARYSDAIDLLRDRYYSAPRAESLYALAEAQQLAGHKDEAAASFEKFESLSTAESNSADNSNRELIAYYIDHAKNPAKALEIARREIACRRDIFTLDAYAWALAANGEYAEANRQMQTALALGVKDQKLLYHAGAIALRLKESAKAEGYLKDAADRHSREAAALLEAMAAER